MLDEATCNLDSHTERKIMNAILRQRHDKTTLLFGHRLSALDQASRIIVLADGQIVETGTLQQLTRSTVNSSASSTPNSPNAGGRHHSHRHSPAIASPDKPA